MFFKSGLDYQALSLPDRFDWDEKKRLSESKIFLIGCQNVIPSEILKKQRSIEK